MKTELNCQAFLNKISDVIVNLDDDVVKPKSSVRTYWDYLQRVCGSVCGFYF